MRRIYVDINRCTGCRICELICSFEHYNVFNPKKARIRVFRRDSVEEVSYCRQCGECIEVCPEEVIVSENGIVTIKDNCTGCGVCVDECPFSAIVIVDNRATKCDLCEKCAELCPTEAISIRSD